MILREINKKGFDDIKLKLNVSENRINWESYFNQYKNVLFYLARNQNPLGARYISLLFIFRHTVELFLKKRLTTIELSHSINELFNKTENLPSDFLKQLEILKCEGDGSDFRYYRNKEGKTYFNNEIINIKAPIEYFLDICGLNVILTGKHKGHFNIYANYNTIGQIATDYDESMCLIIDGIIQKKLSINEVYLPLIFIIRHSIELSLKQNLIVAGQNYLSDNDISNILQEHSIAKLFHKFEMIINIALNNMSKKGDENVQNFKKETEEYQQKLNSLQSLIQNLDSNSYFYRFPIDRNGNSYNLTLNERKIIELLKLRLEVDAYLTFAIPVLQEYGYLEYCYE